MTELKKIIEKTEEFAPLNLACSWDNVGLILGDRNKNVNKILLALDLDIDIAKEAKKAGAEAVFTHHPIMFKPVNKINTDTPEGRCILYMLQNDIALYSAHTNLDAAEGGLNDYLAALYELEDVKVTDTHYTDENGRVFGLGRCGKLPKEFELEELAGYIREKTGANDVSYVGESTAKLKTAAICSGGGGSRVNAETAEAADVYITGDIKYSNARDASALGLNLISIGHYDTEIFCMDIFEKLFADFDIEIIKSRQSKNVFKKL